jgi:hypothetical protein
MKKLFLIVYGGVVVIAIIVSIYLHAKQKNQNTEAAIEEPAVVETGPLYAYSADGTQGQLIDPNAKALRIDSATGNALLQETTEYTLEYFANGKSFNITLLGTNLRQSRINAEQELLSRFGITSEQACSLEVHVGTIVSVSAEFSARELGLSFCPERVDLPVNVNDATPKGTSGGSVPDVSLE